MEVVTTGNAHPAAAWRGRRSSNRSRPLTQGRSALRTLRWRVPMSAVLASVLALAAPAAAQAPAEPWPTTAFEVFFLGSDAFPGDPTHFATRGKDAATPNERQWSQRVKDYISDAATRFEAAGFRPPVLGTAFTGGQGYRVFLGDEPKKMAWYGWNPISSYIAISKTWFEHSAGLASAGDPPPPAAGSEWDMLLYLTLAHELFHAIQEAYVGPLAYATHQSWDSENRLDHSSVDEGLPTAMARWALSQRFPNWVEQRMQRGNANREKYPGVYPYHRGFLFMEPPATNPSGTGYLASSFWFNLLERFGPELIQHLLNQPVDHSTTQTLMMWLDDGLKSFLPGKEGLYSVYPHFLAELAAYGVVPRYQGYPDPYLSRVVFGNNCPVIAVLYPNNEVATRTLADSVPIPPLGAACVRVEWMGYDPNLEKYLEIEVSHANPYLVDQLNVAVAALDPAPKGAPVTGTCWSYREHNPAPNSCVLEQPIPVGNARTWTLDTTWASGQARGEARIVIANIAPDPATTRAVGKLKITFGLRQTKSGSGPPRAPSRTVPLKLGMPTSPEYMRYRQYGLNPDPPLQETIGEGALALMTTFAPVAVPKGLGPDAVDEARYVVTPDPGRTMPLGYTGALHGAVVDMSPTASALGRAGSPLCASNEGKPIGQVVAYDSTVLKVDVQTDVCRIDLRAGGTSLVERLDVTAVIPFGWQAAQPAPVSTVTPGVQYFVDRFHARLEGRVGGSWPFGGLQAGSVAVSTAAPAGQHSSPAPPAGGPAPCDCSCAGFARLQELSKRRDPAAEAELRALQPCMRQCMTTWVRSCQR